MRRLYRASLLIMTLACAPHEPEYEPLQGPNGSGSGARETCPLGMVLISGGTLGTSRIEKFCVDSLEVSAAEYRACLDAGTCTAMFSGDPGSCSLFRSEGATEPVNCVEYMQAQAYCSFRGKRLPSASEWSWVARGGGQGLRYPWGSEEADPRRACIGRTRAEGSCAVGSFPNGASPGGVLDLVGNVAEWVVNDAAEADTGRGLLAGGAWSTWPAIGEEPFDIVPGAGTELADSARGFRCAVAVHTEVRGLELGPWRAFEREVRELPVLAPRPSRAVPGRALENLTIISRDGASWWPVADRYIRLDEAVAPALGVRDPISIEDLPPVIQDSEPMVKLGEITLWRGGWARGRHFVAFDTHGPKIRWEVNLAVYGSSFIDLVGPQTLVAGIYGDEADQLIGFALDDGSKVWQLKGGQSDVFHRLDAVWIEGERAYASGDRGVLSFDPATGAILWSGVALGRGCGLAHSPGWLILERENSLQIVDAKTGAELRQIDRPGGATGCRWGLTDYEGGVADGVIADDRLFAFGEVKDELATLYAVDLKTGAIAWKRPRLDVGVLAADNDAVYVASGGQTLQALHVATGTPAIEFLWGGAFDLEVVGGGGAAGPLVRVETANAGTWVLARAPEPTIPESYTIRGRLVADDGVAKRRIAGVRVQVGGRKVKTDSRGRFRVKGRGLGVVGVAPHSLEELYEAAEHGWGPFFIFSGENVVLDGSGSYDLGELTLYRWYSE